MSSVVNQKRISDGWRNRWVGNSKWHDLFIPTYVSCSGRQGIYITVLITEFIKSFLKFINAYGFYQYVTEPTIDYHILDLVLSASGFGLQSLERRRVGLNQDLILVCKFIHRLTKTSLSDKLILQQLNNTRNHSYKLVKSLCSHKFTSTFTNCIVDAWNNLHNDVICGKSLYSFVCRLNKADYNMVFLV